MFPVYLQDLPDMVAVKDADFSDVDAVFCCLPHGTTQVCKRFHNMLLNFNLNASTNSSVLVKYEGCILL